MENKKIVLDKNQLILKKYLKSYLTAKKYYDTNLDKSFEYFKQCVKIINDIRDKNIPIEQDYVNIINETETECSRYLTNTIEQTIERPIKKEIIPTSNNNLLFEIIETGNINELKKYKYGHIDFNGYNEQGLTPLHYAIKFGDVTFLKQSFKLGAFIDQTNQSGHTLLEYACLEKDPNMINFLLHCGADMNKHLKFREGKKFFNGGNQIDIMLFEKMIIENEQTNNEIQYLSFLFKYLNKTDTIELGHCEQDNSTILKNNIQMNELIRKLDSYLNTLDENSRNTYIKIIKEELSNEISFKLGCPNNKIHILFYNLIPFIDYSDNLRLDWLLSLEIKYLILKILKNKVKINMNQLRKELTESLYLSYIKPEIIPEGLIQIIVSQWIYKIKV